MRTVMIEAAPEELITQLCAWSDLMAAGDWAAAADFLHPPAEGSRAESWTASTLRTYVQNYGAWDGPPDGSALRVTPTAEAEARQPGPHEVYSRQNRPPLIEFWIPFNGMWSDLVATVEVTEHDGRWAFVLYDLRVP